MNYPAHYEWMMHLYSALLYYIYAFSRRFYPKRLTVHSGYTFFVNFFCSLGFEPTTFCAANAVLYHWATGTLLYTQSALQSCGGGSLLNHLQCAASSWMMVCALWDRFLFQRLSAALSNTASHRHIYQFLEPNGISEAFKLESSHRLNRQRFCSGDMLLTK